MPLSQSQLLIKAQKGKMVFSFLVEEEISLEDNVTVRSLDRNSTDQSALLPEALLTTNWDSFCTVKGK